MDTYRQARDRALQERDVARQKQTRAEAMGQDALARAERAEAALAAEREKMAKLRAFLLKRIGKVDHDSSADEDSIILAELDRL